MARAFVAEKGWDWPQIKDPNREIARRIGATYQPYVALLDAEGTVVATLDGGGERELWEAMIDRLPGS